MSTQDGSSSSHASNATLIRQIILVGLLIVVGAAAAYDRMSARPGAEKAYKEIQDQADERIGSSAPPLNSEDIQEIVGKAPSHKEMGPNKYVEKYSWMAGLPWRSYWIWVVYSPLEQKSIEAKKKPIFEMHFLNEALPAEYEPQYVQARPEVAPPSEPVAAGAGGGGGGGAPGAGNGGERGGRNRRPPSDDTPPGDTPAEPTNDKPADDSPAADKPAEDKPADDEPAADKPAEVKPAEEKPAEDKPASDQPAGDAPSAP